MGKENYQIKGEAIVTFFIKLMFSSYLHAV